MKKIQTLLLVAATALIVSCQKDDAAKQSPSGENVNVSFSAAIPGNITTYGSADGGATNLQAGGVYDLRYVLEVCKIAGGTSTLIHREVKTTPDFSTPMHFSFGIPKDTYEFLIWADFVLRGTTADLFYDASNLRNQVKMIPDAAKYAICQEARDAYFLTAAGPLEEGGYADVVLARPFGKMRFIATDRVADSNAVAPKSASVDFGGIQVPTTFNLSLGQPQASTQYISLGEYSAEATVENNVVVNNTLLPPGDYYLLGYDYIFPNKSQPTLPLQINIYDAADNIMDSRVISAVPVDQNKLTTVIGRFYTGALLVGLDISVGDAFYNSAHGAVVDVLPTSISPLGGVYNIASKLGTDTEVWFGDAADNQTYDWTTYTVSDIYSESVSYAMVTITVKMNTGERRTGDLIIGKRRDDGSWIMDKTIFLRVDQQEAN